MLAPALKPGDTIGVFSPSMPATAFAPKRTQRAIDFLRAQGHNVLMGSLSGKSEDYRSGSIAARVDELNALIRDPDVRCIMSSVGGSNSNSLLPHIDYDALKRDPKIFCGYSDVTAIHTAIYARTGLVTFYGPALTASLGALEPIVSHTWQAFLSVVRGEATTLPNPAEWTDEMIDWETQSRTKTMTPNALITLTGGSHTGRLIGGNLNTLNGVWGTPFEPVIKDGDVLFLEDSLKDAATVERSFARLYNSGVLDRIGGLILGKHELFKSSGARPHEILLEVCGGQLACPTLVEYDSAHTHPMITLPLGATVTLDADAQHVTIESGVVSMPGTP